MREEKEYKDILKCIYPVGEERWIKVLYTDFDKAKKI